MVLIHHTLNHITPSWRGVMGRMRGKLPEHDPCHMKRPYSVARGNVGLCHCWAADACKRDAMARWLVRVGTAGATCACEMASVARGDQCEG